MFHILSLEGSVFDVPLESLRKREELKRIERAAPMRKVAGGGNETGERETAERVPSYGEKAYRAAIRMGDEGEPLLHAFEIMSRPVITIDRDMTVAAGWGHFQRSGVRHMPVLAGAAIVGIVSERNLLTRLIQREEEEAAPASIAAVMAQPVISASQETDIRRIARVMFENHVGAMPVLDGRKLLAGIITRSDILFALIHHGPLKLWA